MKITALKTFVLRSGWRNLILPFLSLGRSVLLIICVLSASVAPTARAQSVPASDTDKIRMSIDISKPGPKIDRNIFGQFAEHLGAGVYEGIWVGPESKIPNTRGIRNDVVGALRAIKDPRRHQG